MKAGTIVLFLCCISLLNAYKMSKIDSVRKVRMPTAYFLSAIVVIGLMAYSYDSVPPVTILISILLLVVHSRLFPEFKVPISKVCMDSRMVLKKRQYFRLISGSLYHANDFHLIYNLISFSIKAIAMEDCFGSDHFLLIFFALCVLTNILLIPMSKLGKTILGKKNSSKCIVGINGANFAMHTIQAILIGNNGLAYWIELPIMCFLMPKTTFIANIAGVSAGIIAMFILDRISKMHAANVRGIGQGCRSLSSAPRHRLISCRQAQTSCNNSCVTNQHRQACRSCGHTGCSGGCGTGNGGFAGGHLMSRKKWFWVGSHGI